MPVTTTLQMSVNFRRDRLWWLPFNFYSTSCQCRLKHISLDLFCGLYKSHQCQLWLICFAQQFCSVFFSFACSFLFESCTNYFSFACCYFLCCGFVLQQLAKMSAFTYFQAIEHKIGTRHLIPATVKRKFEAESDTLRRPCILLTIHNSLLSLQICKWHQKQLQSGKKSEN